MFEEIKMETHSSVGKMTHFRCTHSPGLPLKCLDVRGQVEKNDSSLARLLLSLLLRGSPWAVGVSSSYRLCSKKQPQDLSTSHLGTQCQHWAPGKVVSQVRLWHVWAGMGARWFALPHLLKFLTRSHPCYPTPHQRPCLIFLGTMASAVKAPGGETW